MENASKALIMAGGVLIGILVLSLGLYLFMTFAQGAAKINDKIAENQMAEFNSNYTSCVGREDITIYDIITILSRAKEFNDTLGEDSSIRNSEEYITINLQQPGKRTKTDILQDYIGKSSDIQDDYRAFIQECIQNDVDRINSGNSLPNYECTIKSYNSFGRVHEIIFKAK